MAGGGHGLRGLVSHARGEGGFAFAFLAVTPVMRAGRAHDASDWQVEFAMHALKAGKASRCDGRSVIGFLAGDDLLLVRLAAGVLVIPDELHRRVDRLGTGIGVHCARQAVGGDVDQPLGQLDQRRA